MKQEYPATDKEMQLNAPLYGAAPEMLEALEEILEVTGGYVPNTPKATWAKAFAAVKKAKGEE